MTDLRLYDYAASSNCYKARLLLAQLDRPYERVPVDIFAGETLTDEYAQINPARTTLVLETEHGYLPESNAILVYLAAGTPLLPDDPFELAQVVRWLIYEQTDVSPTTRGLRFLLLVGRLAPDDPEAVRGREGAQAVLRRRSLHDRGHRDLRLLAPRARGRNRHGAIPAPSRLVRPRRAAARLHRGRRALWRERRPGSRSLALRLSGIARLV
jgi:Glutathione S-transferase, N-terminal domain